jgi:hypothetical protein
MKEAEKDFEKLGKLENDSFRGTNSGKENDF